MTAPCRPPDICNNFPGCDGQRAFACRECGSFTCACADCGCTACPCPTHPWNAA